MTDLWSNTDPDAWHSALGRYAEVIVGQGVTRLPDLDRWYRDELPPTLTQRTPRYVNRDELARMTEWKMARGVWRQRNLLLVRSNEPAVVEETSRDALARVPDPTAPIAALSKLAGVGPATASAVLSAAVPEIYPFFDELVAAQVPDLGKVDFTLRYYARYADALRDHAQRLGDGWTPTLVERALWAHAGGKASQG